MQRLFSSLFGLLAISALLSSTSIAAIAPGHSADPDPKNEKARRSDSAVRVEVSPMVFDVGDTFVVELILDNTSTAGGGPLDIFNVVTTLTIPTGLSINSVAPGVLSSCSFSSQVATCTNISFPGNASSTNMVNVSADVVGSYTLLGTTTHADFDPDTSNNTATKGITVNEVTGSISGTVFEDLNANGVLDPGEPAKFGVLMTLSGAASGSVNTDVNGAYTFSGLDAGDYTVAVGAVPGMNGEASHPSAPLSGTRAVSLATGENRMEVDFLAYRDAIVIVKVFHDTNGDGVFDATEPNLAGVEILRIDDCLAEIGDLRITNDAGIARFDQLKPQTYCFRVNPNQSFPMGQIGVAMLISAPPAVNGVIQLVVTVSSDDEITPSPFFNVHTHGKISGSKVIVDGNGVVLEGDSRQAGWTIVLKDGEGQQVATTTTEADGTYAFTEIVAGNYQVEESIQENWEQILPGEASGFKHTIQLTSDGHQSGINFSNQFQDQDISVAKTFSPLVVAEDDTVTVTIVVSNIGTTPADNVEMTDILTDFFEFVSVSTTVGTCSEANRTVVCGLGTLGPGQSETVTIVTVAFRVGDTSNTATATTTSNDMNSTNNSSTVAITVHPVDLTLTLVTVQHQTCIKGLLDVDTETTDGNRVIIRVAVTNGSIEKAEFVSLTFTEFFTGKILNDGSGTMSGIVQAGTSRIFEYTWNTTGWAWTDAEAAHTTSRLIKVNLVRKGDPFGEVEKLVLVKPKPVILVHGLWSNFGTWASYSGFAEAKHSKYAGRVLAVPGMDTGLDPATAFASSSRRHEVFTKTTIADNAETLDGFIKTVRQATNSCHVDIVSHSMGGLISRSWVHNQMPAQEADEERMLRHLVQLGTPNEGSECTDDIMAMYPRLVTSGNLSALVLQKMRPPNNIIELTTTHVIHTFNQQVNNYKDVPIYIGYGNGIPFTCRAFAFGDALVAARSALASQTSNPIFTGQQSFLIRHTSMAGSASIFNGFVKPILAEPPGGGPLNHEPSEEDSESDDRFATKGAVDGQEYFHTSTQSVLRDTEVTIDLTVGLSTSFGVTFLAPPSLTSRLFDPSGTEVFSVIANSEESSVGLRAHTIENPQTGTWQLKVSQSEADSVGLMTAAWVIGSDVTLSLSVDLALEANHVLVSSEFLSGAAPILGATATAVAIAEEGTSQFPLNDDGLDGDAQAGDGIYSALFRPEQPGTFLFSVDAASGDDTRTTTINQEIQGISGVGIDRRDDVIPKSIAVGSAYPNPAQSSATLPFLVSTPSDVDIRIYDVLGKEVRVIANARMQPGAFEASFQTSGLPSGQYIIRARIGNRSFTRFISVVR